MTTSPANQETLLQQLWQAIRNKDGGRAIKISNQLNYQFPEFAAGWQASSQLAQMINQPQKALVAIERALELVPENADWRLQRVACLIKCSSFSIAGKELADLAGDARKHGLKTSVQLTQLAFLCSRMDMHDEAEGLYRKLIQIEPRNGGHWYNLATIQRFKGMTSEAEASLEKAIGLNAADYDAYEMRSDLHKQTPESNHIAELESILEHGIDVPAGEVRVRYALAKELEDIGQNARAFQSLAGGAALRRKHINYSIEHDLETIDSIRTVFGKSFFARPSRGHASREPVFIIGLPRTGTTLLEQILGSHSDVFAAGELNNFAVQMMLQVRERSANKNITRQQLVQQTSQLDFERLGKSYLDSTRPRTGRTPHFIDKMPLNFLYAGLIHQALPGARILHLTRHPMDTCYAIYKRLFQDAYPWSYDQGEIAAYYHAYHRLMVHWKTVMPGVIQDIAYEDLIKDSEAQARKAVDWCHLPWQPQCLSFYDQATHSTTASASQVRQPIYSSSIGLWKKYSRELAPLAGKLREFGIGID